MATTSPAAASTGAPPSRPPSGTMERILRLMVDKKASDVYLSAMSPALIRINGVCVPINSQPLPPEAPLALLSEILSAEAIDTLRTEHELNTAISIASLGRFRISAMRQRGTYAAVIRLIVFDIPPLDSLGVPMTLGDLMLIKRGLILMVGGTGAGKSTTLASMIDHRNAHMTGHILTIEDPIEYLFKNKRSVVNQREVGTDTPSMQVALKNALRQAPDVILIGEIRDQAAMTAAITYAQTGHLCLATLHANNSYQALNRILNFYPPDVRPAMLADLAACLRAIVSQRLLHTLDDRRTPAVEVMVNTQLISEMIGRGDFGGIMEAMEKSLAENSQTFEQDLARLVLTGVVDRKEALIYADSPTNLMWRLQNDFDAKEKAKSAPALAQDDDDKPTFTEFTLNLDA